MGEKVLRFPSQQSKECHISVTGSVNVSHHFPNSLTQTSWCFYVHILWLKKNKIIIYYREFSTAAFTWLESFHLVKQSTGPVQVFWSYTTAAAQISGSRGQVLKSFGFSVQYALRWLKHKKKNIFFFTSRNCSHLYVVQELEVAGSVGSIAHSLSKLYGASSTLRPVVARHGVWCPTLFC